MSTKIAINGFGRIGRLLFRQLADREDMEVIAVNDLGDVDQLAYLLKYDSVYKGFNGTVEVKDGMLLVNEKEIKVLQERDPANLPWGDMGVDVVAEATGVFNTYTKAKAHLDAGAKRVVITAPSKEEDGENGQTVLMGVNEDKMEGCSITSNGSCTTNAASPVMEVLASELGIEKAFLLTTHGYTATQSIVDGPSKDMRKGRAAAVNIIPSSTGAASTVSKAVKGFEGKFDGVALRVPVPAGSVANISLVSKKKTSVEEVNGILSEAANSDRWKGILKVTDEPLVSSDVQQEPYGAIVDLSFTRVIDGDLVSVMSWYDNEWGYVSTLVRHLEKASQTI